MIILRKSDFLKFIIVQNEAISRYIVLQTTKTGT